MNDVAYRSIFPNNNVPAPIFNFKTTTTLKDQLKAELSSLINLIDFSEVSAKIHELEFKVDVQEDPVKALLTQLSQINERNI